MTRAVMQAKGDSPSQQEVPRDMGGPKIDADQVRLLIEEVLERRAEREAERIYIAMRNGTVIMSGRVRSWAEKRAILGAISHAPGVAEVKETLFVDPLL